MKKLSAGIFLLLAFPIGVFADSIAPPCSYKVEAKKSGAVFVMLSEQDNACIGRSGPQAEEAKALREKYKASGLYADSKSTTPLWTVDWFSYEVILSPDGKHLVRMGPWASSTSQEAFTFFADGKEVKKYAISDLVKNESGLKRTASHFFWLQTKYLNDTNNTFDIETLEGGKFTFDLSTGEITKQTPGEASVTAYPSPTVRSPEKPVTQEDNSILIVILVAAITGMIAGAIMFFVMMRMKKK